MPRLTSLAGAGASSATGSSSTQAGTGAIDQLFEEAALPADEEPAGERLLARVVALEDRRVARVPLAREVGPALLHPAGEVRRPDRVRAVEHGVARLDDGDGRVLDGHTVARDLERLRAHGLDDEAAV